MSAPSPASVPPPRRTDRLLLALADGFMAAMLSRPPTGTLATTRVTTATIWLAATTSAACALATAAVFVAVLAGQASGVLALPAAVCLTIAGGSACLALYGIRQRRAKVPGLR